MSSLRRRLVFDLAMTVLLVFEMFYSLTGNLLHELFGILFFITVTIHLFLDRVWFGSVIRALRARHVGSQTRLRAVLFILLATATLLLCASSVAISKDVLGALGVSLTDAMSETYLVWVLVHIYSSYVLCAITCIHVIVHWKAIAASMRIPYQPARRRSIETMAGAIGGICCVALFGNAIAEATRKEDRFVATRQMLESLRETSEVPVTDETLPDEQSREGQATEKDRSSSRKNGNTKGDSSETASSDGDESSTSSGTSDKDKTSSKSSSSSKDSSKSSSADQSDADTSHDDSGSGEDSSGSNSKPTLMEYLAARNCNGCSKRCPLNAIRCDGGLASVAAAKAAYAALYG